MPLDRSRLNFMAFAKMTVSGHPLGQVFSYAHALASHLVEPYATTHVGIHG
jgi:hypothetical protein